MSEQLLYRIGIKLKETDKRKNATVHRYVVMASSLEEARTLAVAAWMDPEDSDYRTHRLAGIAAVFGGAMSTLAYNADIYGDKDRSEQPESVPEIEAVRAARGRLQAFEQAHEDERA